MAEDRESMASGLLESLEEGELLGLLVDATADALALRGLRPDEVHARVIVDALVAALIERSFPRLAGNASVGGIKSDVAEAIMSHEPSMLRLERLRRALHDRQPRTRKGRA